VVKDLLNGDSLEQVTAKHSTVSQQVLDWLVEQGFGAFHETQVVSEHYEPRSSIKIRGLFESPPIFQTVYFQLSDSCDAKCRFCNDRTFHNWQGCNSCMRWPRRQEYVVDCLSPDALDGVIDDLSNYNVPKVIFSGGNPLIEFDTVTNVSRKLREIAPEITIAVHTNSGHFNEAVVAVAKELDIEFVFSIFGTNESDYSLTTETPGLYGELCKALSSCREADITYDLTLVISMAMRGEYERFCEETKSMGGRKVFTTEVISRHGKKEGTVSLPTGSRRVEGVGPHEFFQRHKYNYCLNGMIAIAANGSILPCPSWGMPIGSIHTEQNLRSLFRSGAIDKYWEATKDTTEICRDCENRYGCVDCSLLEREIIQDPEAVQHFCHYDVTSGEWPEENGKNEKWH